MDGGPPAHRGKAAAGGRLVRVRLLISLAATFNLSVDSCSSYYLEVSVCKVIITIWFPFGYSYITNLFHKS